MKPPERYVRSRGALFCDVSTTDIPISTSSHALTDLFPSQWKGAFFKSFFWVFLFFSFFWWLPSHSRKIQTGGFTSVRNQIVPNNSKQLISDDFIKTQSFKCLPLDFMKHVLEKNALTSTEEEIWEYCVKWSKYQFEKKSTMPKALNNDLDSGATGTVHSRALRQRVVDTIDTHFYSPPDIGSSSTCSTST